MEDDAPAKKRKPRKKTPPEPRGLTARQVTAGAPPGPVMKLMEAVEQDGGSVIGAYRDPLGGNWQIIAALPIEKVAPTPYQRDLSEPHVQRLCDAMEKLGRFVDPIIAVRAGEGEYWTPNGNHRLAALRSMGGRSIVGLVVPEAEVAHRILVLNTEKAHNVRERALEVIRLAEAFVDLDDRPEREFETEFEEPALITLGCCYQKNGRFSGGAYAPILRRTESFSSARLSTSLSRRRERAERLLELDGLVADVVKQLKERGLESPYLKAFVIARVNPIRFHKGARRDPDEVIEEMLKAVRRFDPGRIRPDQVARAAGPPEE